MDKDMTCWLIGPDLEKFYIPYAAITEREHLKKMGILEPHGEHGWRVTKPSFADIDPESFRPVAEFLCTGEFKARSTGPTGEPLEEEDLKSEAIELYAGAWEVANDLSLDDMMEAIIEKMRATQPWPLVELLIFASRVYSIPSVLAFPVEANIEMRSLTSSFISANYNQYLNEHQETLMEKLQQFPELRRDVHQAMANEAAKEMDDD